MKKICLSLIILLSLGYARAQEFNIVSYNIRYNEPRDGINVWGNRKDEVVGILNFYQPMVFGLQEVLLDQLQYIDNELSDYDWVGVGRDDGATKGEFVPIFYNRNFFGLEESGTFWLSQTPEKPGIGWDAACNRVCTWAKLKVKYYDKTVYFFNLHLDYLGQVAQEESINLLINKINDINPKNETTIIAGDFNIEPISKPIQFLSRYYYDAATVSKTKAIGPKGTYVGFDPSKFEELLAAQKIDYIFVSKFLKPTRFGVLTNSNSRRYPSDHLPILTTIDLGSK
ncbi:MAG: endonuclease/exonuclease/phosphatase family protein [Bacteroidales bacterium]